MAVSRFCCRLLLWRRWPPRTRCGPSVAVLPALRPSKACAATSPLQAPSSRNSRNSEACFGDPALPPQCPHDRATPRRPVACPGASASGRQRAAAERHPCHARLAALPSHAAAACCTSRSAAWRAQQAAAAGRASRSRVSTPASRRAPRASLRGTPCRPRASAPHARAAAWRLSQAAAGRCRRRASPRRARQTGATLSPQPDFQHARAWWLAL
mmetsp:Transcript_33035/g.108512  ORF Transcript_33035/g.108512 Transcript_33035/m.108512 type:complete len:213 (+) Transcript_33035:399-1037(+)